MTIHQADQTPNEHPAYSGLYTPDLEHYNVLGEEPDFTAMTLADVTDYKASIKALIDNLHEKARNASVHQARLVAEAEVHEAEKQLRRAMGEPGGKSSPLEQAYSWLVQEFEDPGKHILARKFINAHEAAS